MNSVAEKLKHPWPGAWALIPEHLSQDQREAWKRRFPSAQFRNELSIPNLESLGKDDPIPVTSVIEAIVEPTTESAQGDSTSTRVADHTVASLLGGVLGEKPMGKRTFQKLYEELQATFGLREVAREKLRYQASLTAAAAGEKRGEEAARELDPEELDCYLTELEQRTLLMPLLNQNTVLSEPVLSSMARAKLQTQGLRAAKHAAEKEKEKEGKKGKTKHKKGENKPPRRYLELSEAEQKAMFMMPLQTIKIALIPGGPAMVNARAAQVQQASPELANVTLKKQDLTSAQWYQAAVNELDSVFGRCGESKVEEAFSPSRCLIQMAAERFPLKYRSFMGTPSNFVGAHHQYVFIS